MHCLMQDGVLFTVARLEPAFIKICLFLSFVDIRNFLRTCKSTYRYWASKPLLRSVLFRGPAEDAAGELPLEALQAQLVRRSNAIIAEAITGLSVSTAESFTARLVQSSAVEGSCGFIAMRGTRLALRTDNKILVLDLVDSSRQKFRDTSITASFPYDPKSYHFFSDDIPSPLHRGQVKRWSFTSDTFLVAVTKFFGFFAYDITSKSHRCLLPETLPKLSDQSSPDLFVAGRFGEVTACDSKDSCFILGGGDGSVQRWRLQGFSASLCASKNPAKMLGMGKDGSPHVAVQCVNLSEDCKLLGLLFHNGRQAHILDSNELLVVRTIFLANEAEALVLAPHCPVVLIVESDVSGSSCASSHFYDHESGQHLWSVRGRLLSPSFTPEGFLFSLRVVPRRHDLRRQNNQRPFSQEILFYPPFSTVDSRLHENNTQNS